MAANADLMQAVSFGFREPNKEAVRLVDEMNLKCSLPLIRMYLEGRQPQASINRVFAITSDVCVH